MLELLIDGIDEICLLDLGTFIRRDFLALSLHAIEVFLVEEIVVNIFDVLEEEIKRVAGSDESDLDGQLVA